jgi:hypothetical protein
MACWFTPTAHSTRRAFTLGNWSAAAAGGDTTLAAYVSCRLDASPAEATLWAAAVASLKMEAEGPFDRDLEEVERLIQEKYTSPSQPPQPAYSDS